jgi:hypothetical protein
MGAHDGLAPAAKAVENACGVGLRHEVGNLAAGSPTKCSDLVVLYKLSGDRAAAEDERNDVSDHDLVDACERARFDRDAGVLVDLPSRFCHGSS